MEIDLSDLIKNMVNIQTFTKFSIYFNTNFLNCLEKDKFNQTKIDFNKNCYLHSINYLNINVDTYGITVSYYYIDTNKKNKLKLIFSNKGNISESYTIYNDVNYCLDLLSKYNTFLQENINEMKNKINKKNQSIKYNNYMNNKIFNNFNKSKNNIIDNNYYNNSIFNKPKNNKIEKKKQSDTIFNNFNKLNKPKNNKVENENKCNMIFNNFEKKKKLYIDSNYFNNIIYNYYNNSKINNNVPNLLCNLKNNSQNINILNKDNLEETLMDYKTDLFSDSLIKKILTNIGLIIPEISGKNNNCAFFSLKKFGIITDDEIVKYRNLLNLKPFQQLSPTDIAQILGKKNIDLFVIQLSSFVNITDICDIFHESISKIKPRYLFKCIKSLDIEIDFENLNFNPVPKYLFNLLSFSLIKEKNSNNKKKVILININNHYVPLLQTNQCGEKNLEISPDTVFQILRTKFDKNFNNITESWIDTEKNFHKELVQSN